MDMEPTYEPQHRVAGTHLNNLYMKMAGKPRQIEAEYMSIEKMEDLAKNGYVLKQGIDGRFGACYEPEKATITLENINYHKSTYEQKIEALNQINVEQWKYMFEMEANIHFIMSDMKSFKKKKIEEDSERSTFQNHVLTCLNSKQARRTGLEAPPEDERIQTQSPPDTANNKEKEKRKRMKMVEENEGSSDHGKSKKARK